MESTVEGLNVLMQLTLVKWNELRHLQDGKLGLAQVSPPPLHRPVCAVPRLLCCHLFETCL